MNRIAFNPLQGTQTPQATRPQGFAPTGRFADSLQVALQKQDPVRFSAHAAQRLQDRQIRLSPADLQHLNSAVDKAAAKGGKDTLVVMDKAALIVSVPNRTVVTALPADELNEAVFTQIDSTVFAGGPATQRVDSSVPLL